MVSLEGIPSPFPAQPRKRSPKPGIYESLFLWNEGVDQLIATLRSLERFFFADKHSLQCTQAEIEEIRAGVNADFVEAISEYERHNQGRFWKQRRTYEKTLEDPDDVIEVQALLQKFYEYTGSERPWRILQRWEEFRPKFVKVYPNDYRRVLETQKRFKAQGLSEDEAVMAAFEVNSHDAARVGGK